MRDYNSPLIFNELDKYDVKISVIPNGLEKYIAFFLNKNFLFTDSMEFMNSNLDKVKNLSDENFKYLAQEFGCENLELLKQKDAFRYEYMNSFERFNEKDSVLKNIFTTLYKMEKLVMMVKYQTVT